MVFSFQCWPNRSGAGTKNFRCWSWSLKFEAWRRNQLKNLYVVYISAYEINTHKMHVIWKRDTNYPTVIDASCTSCGKRRSGGICTLAQKRKQLLLTRFAYLLVGLNVYHRWTDEGWPRLRGSGPHVRVGTARVWEMRHAVSVVIRRELLRRESCRLAVDLGHVWRKKGGPRWPTDRRTDDGSGRCCERRYCWRLSSFVRGEKREHELENKDTKNLRSKRETRCWVDANLRSCTVFYLKQFSIIAFSNCFFSVNLLHFPGTQINRLGMFNTMVVSNYNSGPNIIHVFDFMLSLKNSFFVSKLSWCY